MKNIKIKLIIVLTFIVSINIITGETTKELIDRGIKIQKEIFDKHFNTESAVKNSAVLTKNVQTETLMALLNKNKKTNTEQQKLLKGNRKSEFKKMYENYELYVVNENEAVRSMLLNLVENREDLQSYIFVNSYNLFEAFDLNMNTYFEAEKDSKTTKENIKTIIDYYYFKGDKVSQNEYLEMNNNKMKEYVNNEFIALNNKVDEKINKRKIENKTSKKIKSDITKMEKRYNEYDKAFETFIDNSNLNESDKDDIKKIIKFETISNIKFLIQSLDAKRE